jgi:predicted nucleotidyltransferase component of viral defense system
MITQDEIDQVAKTLDLSIANVERDYVFGWLISGIFQASDLGASMVLKGGNALRKGYFPLTRFSDDLDFSTAHGLDGDLLLAQLNEICRFTEARTGVAFQLDRNAILAERQIDRERHVYKARLYFKDFADLGEHITLKVRVDVTEYDQLHLPAQPRRLIHQYSDAADCATEIRVVKLEEALADKLKCLLQRRYCYDLFDAVYAIFVSNELAVDRSEIMRVFLKKTIFQPSPGAAKNLLLGVPFELFRGFWQKVICPVASRMTFDQAVERLQLGIEELFAPFGYGQGYERAFFPAELRNPILEAGSAKKLLELRYHGVTRLVEPYALTFKRRKDGGAREYFYAYDRTGGRTSGPSIKTFVATDIETLRLTDATFEPQFEIELAKAGDADTADYFKGTPGRRRLISRPRRPTFGATTTYVIECSYCGKHFRRKRLSLRLNPHKDQYGNPCYGRIGHQVW